MTSIKRRSLLMAIAAAAATPSLPARAQKKYGPGVTDQEIRIGQSIPYSGPASAYGMFGKVEAAYFRMINDEGGINGRKIKYISLDDGYSPPKAVENVRRLVEGEEVAMVFNMLGTPLTMAVRGYLNQKKVPHLFNAAGSAKFADPKNFPWTMGWQPNLRNEAIFYAGYILKNKPNAKVGVLYQDDDFGKELLAGTKEGLGAKGEAVASQSFQATDPTVDSQIIALKGAGIDTILLAAYAKQTAQALRKIADLEWKPDVFLELGSASIGATLAPVGLDRVVGVRTAQFIKDVTDPQWANDAELKHFRDFIQKYMPDANLSDVLVLSGYAFAHTLEQVLRQCGDDLTRENIMKQATSLKNYRNPALLPGSLINTSADEYSVVTFMKMSRFDGKIWKMD